MLMPRCAYTSGIPVADPGESQWVQMCMYRLLLMREGCTANTARARGA